MHLTATVLSLVLSAATPAPDAGSPAAVAKPAGGVKVELLDAVPPPSAPSHFEAAEDSKENPSTPEKIDLGWRLFFDARLSKDSSKACAACHLPDNAFASPEALDAKVGGALNKRNAPSVVNLSVMRTWYWDGRMPTLEAVSAAAWKGQMGADPATVAGTLNQDPVLKAMFQRAFKEDATGDNVPKALASFFRALWNGNSKWDHFQAGDKTTISKDAAQGWTLFTKSGCTLCHAPPYFTDFDFHNVGVGFDKPDAERDHGRKDATKKDEDEGKFRTPSLRNVGLTAPYFHDGSAKTLDEAIDYMAGGFKAGPHLDAKLKAQKWSKKDKAAIKAFLLSLTGETTMNQEPPPNALSVKQ